MHASSSHKLGFTLTELIVSLGIAAFLSTAAFSFVAQQTRALTQTEDMATRDRGARAALELIGHDLRHAGSGLGYPTDGQFAGIQMGSFTVSGGAQFESNNRTIQLPYGPNTENLYGNYESVTDDLGIRFATGEFRSILSLSAGSGQICDGIDLSANQHVAFMSPDGMSAKSARIDAFAAATCASADCMTGGCLNITWSDDNLYESDSGAPAAAFITGEMAESFQNVVWFVADNGRGGTDLRRVEATPESPCADPDANCGLAAVYNVESIQTQYATWDPAARTWTTLAAGATIPVGTAVRADIEIVSRVPAAVDRAADAITLSLEAGRCIPEPCDLRDQYAREVTRGTIYIRNSAISQF